MTKRIVTLLVVVGFLLSSCDWQMPQTVTVKGSPEVYVPSGATVFELDFLDDIAADFGEAMGGADPVTPGTVFSAGEDPSIAEGETFRLFAEIAVESLGDLSQASGGLGVVYSDETAPVSLSDIFGPLPASVQVASAPGEATLSGTGDPTVELRLRASYDGGPVDGVYLVGRPDTDPEPHYEALPVTFETADIFNERPTGLVFDYEFSTTLEDAGNVHSITLRFEIPFALETVGESFLDIEDEEGSNEPAMDGDIFDRDPQNPDADLEDFLDALRGSSAELVMKLENTTGFGATLAMVNGADTSLSESGKQDPANWVVDLGIGSAESLQQVELDISAATLDEMIDGVEENGVSQFKPEFLIELPYNPTPDPPDENQFSIKKGAAFNVTEGFLRVQADFDYTYDLEDEE